MNQSVSNNNDKKKSTQSMGDLNVTHKVKMLEKEVFTLSESVQKKCSQ